MGAGKFRGEQRVKRKEGKQERAGHAGKRKSQARQRQRATALITRIKSLLTINTG